MEITKELLKQKFEEYNKLYFNNELEMCRFTYTYMKMFGRYMTSTTPEGRSIGHIWISRSADWDEGKLRQIIVHEMIHHYVHTIDGKKYDGLFQHGHYFVRQIKRLKKQYGLMILICYPDWHFRNGKPNNSYYLRIIGFLRNKLHIF